MLFIADMNQNNVPVTPAIVMNKENPLFDEIREKYFRNKYVATKGWFHRFKNQYKVNSLLVSGEDAGADGSKSLMIP